MYVASAAYAVPSAAAFPAVRGGSSAGGRAEGLAVAEDDAASRSAGSTPALLAEDPITGRYPVVAFRFNPDASRLVLLYRDPATGETESQIPSEAALKQYEEAQRKEREERKPKLELVVGGRSDDVGNGGYGGTVTGSPGSGSSGRTSTTSGAQATVPRTTAGGATQSPPRSTPVSTDAPAYDSGGSARVNLVV